MFSIFQQSQTIRLLKLSADILILLGIFVVVVAVAIVRCMPFQVYFTNNNSRGYLSLNRISHVHINLMRGECVYSSLSPGVYTYWMHIYIYSAVLYLYTTDDAIFIPL